MVKKISVISVLVMLLVVILVLAPGSACDQGAKQAELPAGPPSVTSFKVASENIAPDQAPLFTWEATNASAVTITQDGVEIYHIEALPDSNAGAFLMPLHDRVYASSTSEYEVKKPYIPGVFPSNFAGAATGKPSHNVWKFGDNKTEPGSAEITSISPDGQVTTATINYIFDGIAGHLDDSRRIVPPPCVRAGSSTPIIPGIKRWAVKNPVVQDGEAPQFEFEVTNPHIISIRHGDEYISYVTIIKIISSLPSQSISLPPFTDEAYASTTSEYDYKQPYSPGIFPVGFTGNDNNKPKKVAWKFGEKSREDSAEITVCSPTGDIVSATVTFTIMRVEEQAPAAPQPPVITFTASRNIVAPMDPVTFTWNVTGDDLTVKLVTDGNQRTIPPSGSENIIIMKSACYYIMAENPAGRASQQQCVTVQSSGFIPPPVYIEPPCPPETAPPLWAPPSTPPTTTPPVAPLTDGY